MALKFDRNYECGYASYSYQAYPVQEIGMRFFADTRDAVAWFAAGFAAWFSDRYKEYPCDHQYEC